MNLSPPDARGNLALLRPYVDEGRKVVVHYGNGICAFGKLARYVDTWFVDFSGLLSPLTALPKEWYFYIDPEDLKVDHEMQTR